MNQGAGLTGSRAGALGGIGLDRTLSAHGVVDTVRLQLDWADSRLTISQWMEVPMSYRNRSVCWIYATRER